MKGDSRPFNNEIDRQYFLQSIKYVDKVVLFNNDKQLKNHLLENHISTMVVGSDWKEKPVVGQEIVQNIIFFDRIGEYSTTRIIGR